MILKKQVKKSVYKGKLAKKKKRTCSKKGKNEKPVYKGKFAKKKKITCGKTGRNEIEDCIEGRHLERICNVLLFCCFAILLFC